MLEFNHVIKDRMGLHARPVTVIASEALRWKSDVTVTCGNRRASARELVELMGLCARQGDALVFRVSGPDEEAAASSLETAVEDL